MKLLPHDTFTIHSPDPIAVVRQKLMAHAESLPVLRMSGDNEFEISPYPKSFAPQIYGRFQQVPGGTMIYVTMELHLWMVAYICIWAIVLFGSFVALLAGAASISSLGLSASILVICWGSFWLEAQRSRDKLSRIILG